MISHPQQKSQPREKPSELQHVKPKLPTCRRDLNTNGKILQEIWSSVPKGGEWNPGKVVLWRPPCWCFKLNCFGGHQRICRNFDLKYLHKSWDTHVQCLFSQFCHLTWRKQSSALWKGPWRRDVAMWNNDPCGKTREHLNNYTRLSPSPEIIKSSADSHEVRNPFLMALHLLRACVRMLSFGVGGPEFWLQFKTDVVRLLQASWLNNQHFVNLSLPTNHPASFSVLSTS